MIGSADISTGTCAGRPEIWTPFSVKGDENLKLVEILETLKRGEKGRYETPDCQSGIEIEVDSLGHYSVYILLHNGQIKGDKKCIGLFDTPKDVVTNFEYFYRHDWLEYEYEIWEDRATLKAEIRELETEIERLKRVLAEEQKIQEML